MIQALYLITSGEINHDGKSKVTTGERQTEQCSRETALTSAALQRKNELTSVAQYAVSQPPIVR